MGFRQGGDLLVGLRPRGNVGIDLVPGQTAFRLKPRLTTAEFKLPEAIELSCFTRETEEIGVTVEWLDHVDELRQVIQGRHPPQHM